MSTNWIGCEECKRGEDHLCAPSAVDGHNTIMDLPGISDADMVASGYVKDALGNWHKPLSDRRDESPAQTANCAIAGGRIPIPAHIDPNAYFQQQYLQSFPDEGIALNLSLGNIRSLGALIRKGQFSSDDARAFVKLYGQDLKDFLNRQVREYMEQKL
jgi:hypothetical protein